MLLRTILTDAGYNVVGLAKDGKGGLELAIKLKPEIVLLDIMMPDSNGAEVLQQIMESLPKTVVLMVTGKRDAETVKDCLEKGAKGFILKPFNPRTVLKVIRGAVGRTVG